MVWYSHLLKNIPQYIVIHTVKGFTTLGYFKFYCLFTFTYEMYHGIWSHHFMGNRWANSGNSVRLYFGGAPKSLQMVTAAMKLKDAYSLEGKL